MEKRKSFPQKVLEHCTSTCKKKNNLNTDLILFSKINSNEITILIVKCKTMRLLEDNIGRNLNDIVYGDDFLNTMPKAPSMVERSVSWISLKLNFCALRKTLSK